MKQPVTLDNARILRHEGEPPQTDSRDDVLRAKSAANKKKGETQMTLLSADEAKRIIAEAFPEFRQSAIEALDGGYDFWTFELDGDWIFRFPKRETSVGKLDKEIDLLSHLGRRLTLPVPAYRRVPDLRQSPRRFAGYRKLPGVQANGCVDFDRPRTARQLGGFLGELHGHPMEIALRAGVPQDGDSIKLWRGRALAQLQEIAGAVEIDPGEIRGFLDRAPECYRGEPRLAHGDLWAEHILIDSRRGRVCGVIDWGDAVIGDPALDFCCLYASFGEGCLSLAIEAYPLGADTGLASRSRYLAACFAVHNAFLCRKQWRADWMEAAKSALRRALRSPALEQDRRG